jgi:hypothetical protein
MRATTPAPGPRRPGVPPPAGPSPWLLAARRRLRERLCNPTLRTLAIADIALLPRGDAFWSPGAERVAIVSLADGLCGYATVGHLPRAARDELVRAVAEVCGVARVRFVPHSVARRRAADALAVFGRSCAALGFFSLLQLPPLVAIGVLIAGMAVVQLGERCAP